MIPRITLVSFIIVFVSLLALAGLDYPSVPVNTSSTVTSSFAQNWLSYSPYIETHTGWFSTTATATVSYYSTEEYQANLNGPPYEQPVVVLYSVATYTGVLPFWGTSESQMSSAILETQTMNTITTTFASYNPAYSTLGLAPTSYVALALVIIGALSLLTWITFKQRTTITEPKQATVTQYVNRPFTCVKCGIDLPPASQFCNKCGAKQA